MLSPIGKAALAAGGGIAAAVGSALCCAGPLVAVFLGLSGAGLAATFEPLRPYLVGATGLRPVLLSRCWPSHGGRGSCWSRRFDMTECCAPDEVDLTRRAITRLALWQLPAVALVAGIFVSPDWRTIVWTVALAVAGAGCVANASRCGRVHCYFTGPVFLLAAAVTLTYGLGVLPLGADGWFWIGLVLAAGSLILGYLPEQIWSKYATHKFRIGGPQ
jgi:hypothetical protein